MKVKSILSWTIIFFGITIFLGCLLYPHWWYNYIFRGKILDPYYFINGLRDIIKFFIFNPILIIAVLGFFVLHKTKVMPIKLPLINIFGSIKKTSITIIASILIGIIIWFFSTRNEEKYIKFDDLLKSELNPTKTDNSPLDFLYINSDRINALFEQIKPDVILKEKQLRTKQGDEKEIRNGENPVVNAKQTTNSENEQTNTYVVSDISEPQKVTALISHFTKNNQLKEYQSLQVSSDDVKSLNAFNTTAKLFEIPYNTAKFSEVYNRVIGETLVKEHSSIKNTSGSIVLIKGDFKLVFDTNRIILMHDYFFLDANNRITFNINSLSRSEKIFGVLKDESQNKKTVSLSVFGKVIRVESNDKISNVYMDVYSIW